MRTILFSCLGVIGFFIADSYSINTITQPIHTPFGIYEPHAKSFIPGMADYTVPDSLSGVLYAGSYSFSDTTRSLLVKNGFAAVPANAQSMTAIYKITNDSKLPVFVTSDVVLHSFYKMYDNMLKIAEYKCFYAGLDSMLESMLQAIVPLRALPANDSVKGSVTRAAAFLDVAHTLLTDTITFAGDSTIRKMVVAETSLVYQHQGLAFSKVLPELREDFSQYVPRGHYTLDAKFEHYFRSMMYLGRMSMSVDSRMATMQACILTRLLATAQAGTSRDSALWTTIYHPTVFFVGKSDDLNFLQYAEVLDRVVGSQWRTGDIGLFYSSLSSIITELKKLPKSLIFSGQGDTFAFHLMGQRFVPDSYAFGQLVYSFVGTESNPRLLPRGLDIMAILGSQRARQLLTGLYHEDLYANYTKQLDSLSIKFSRMPDSQWVENLYWNWLYTLVPLLQVPGKGFPSFMRTQAWLDKSLTSASGSWAELRHASVLYAKQSYTSPVGIPCPQNMCFPQGYVEPVPDVFGRLAAMVVYMKNGLDSVGFSSILPMSKFTALADLCNNLQDIAIAELQSEHVSIKQYCDIAGAYKVLAGVEDFSPPYQVPPAATNRKGGDSSTACIVDVHTDLNSKKVLEVGVGKPMCLYAVVPVEGKLQVCRGAMFSYYEFSSPMDNRLTDVEWQAMLASSKPAMPEWTGSFVSSAEKSAYYNPPEDLTAVIGVNDSVPGAFRGSDSVIAWVSSKTIPLITVEAAGTPRQFSGTPASGGMYRVAIASEALTDTNILTINSTALGQGCNSAPPQIAIVYRRLLVRDQETPTIHASRNKGAFAKPCVKGGRVYFPPGTAWRIVDIRGRGVASIGPGQQVWTPPHRLAHQQLILVSGDVRSQKSMRLMIGSAW